MSLADEIKNRLGGANSSRLVQLTNFDSSAITIDDTVLDSASQDAIAEFQRITGLSFDINNKTHVAICVQGVLFFLENYKGRSAGIISEHRSQFYGSCSRLREVVYIMPATNSILLPSQERANARFDMDRKASVFGDRIRVIKVGDVNEEN